MGTPQKSIRPKNLLVFYAYPSCINKATSLQGAAQEFGKYDYVILGAGLEECSHPNHQNTVCILSMQELANTFVFGYIDASVTISNFSLSEIKTRIKEWKTTGVKGIFYDCFGYDYGVSRQRQIDLDAAAHSLKMPVAVNAWKPADVFDQLPCSMNPGGKLPPPSNIDFYFWESYQITQGLYQDAREWRAKAVAVETYRGVYNFKVLSTTTTAGGKYSQQEFWYAWYSALLDGHEAISWGEYDYSASSASASAPFHRRPDVRLRPGSSFLTPVRHQGARYWRRINLNETMRGRQGEVWIDAAAHEYGFKVV